MTQYWAIIFVGALGSSDADMKPSLSVGPFPEPELCYGAAALGISGLNDKNPRKDFRAVCATDSRIVKRPGQPLLDLCKLAALAGVPFNKPCV